jgi:hypothetical protein
MTEIDPAVAAALKRAQEVADLGTRLKAAMLKQGRTAGWVKCPTCGGRVIAKLVGPRQHLHMECGTEGCDVRLME